MLDFRGGTNVLDAGLIETDRLLLTYSEGGFQFNGATLHTQGGTIDNGQPFVVGATGTNVSILDVRGGTPLEVNQECILGAYDTAASWR